MRRPVVTLLLLASLTFFLGLGRQAITDSDEGFYAEAAREMVESGDWVTPHFNYEDRWQKPALYYWLTAATYLAAGPTEFAARWWSALSGLGLVLLTWMAARRLTTRDDAAWLAGAIVATTFGCFAMARMALPDLPLALLITATIWYALERRWMLAGAAAGLGFLMKGPLAIAVPAIVLVPVWWRERQYALPRLRDLALAAVVCALIGLPWYAAMTFEHGAAYLNSFFVGDNLERFATERFNEPRPFWFYVPIVIGGMLPWSMFLFVTVPSVTDVLRRRRRLTAEEWRILAWILVPPLFFTLSVGKQPRYILPMLPPLAILLARAVTTRVTARPVPTSIGVATWLTALLFVVFAVLLLRAEPLFITAYPALTYAAIAAIVASAAVLAWIAVSRRWALLPSVMTGCAAVLLLSVQFGAFAGTRPEPVEQMAALVGTHRLAGEPVATYQVFVRNLVFYTRFQQIDLFSEEHAVDLLRSPTRTLFVVRATDLPRLEEISGVIPRRLASVRYLNTANIRLRTVLAPIPSQDVEEVLLVANR